METVTDEYMREHIAQSRTYMLVILKSGPSREMPDAEKIAWEHGRRNFTLRAEGLPPIVCPVTDDSDVGGIGIFDADVERTRKIMDDDQGVRAGLFVYELHPVRGFPGDCLPSK